MVRIASLAALLVLSTLCLPSPAAAGEIERSFPFELDKWYDLDVTEGPVTVHRVRVAKLKGNLKSRFTRPSNAEFTLTVQIQVEYTNRDDRDYETDLDIVWVDADGNEIDGYRDDEDMDDEETDKMTAAFSTSKYGLEQAKRLLVNIEW